MPAMRAASVLSVVLALALGGCSLFGKKEEPPPCPRISVLSDAAAITRMTTPGDPRTTTLHADLDSYSGSCQYDPKTKVMTVRFSVGIDAVRGPAAGPARRDVVAYFVTLPDFFPLQQAKKLFNVGFSFPSDRDSVHVDDRPVTVSFRADKLEDLTPYEIYIGFQLSQAELDYNRKLPPRP